MFKKLWIKWRDRNHQYSRIALGNTYKTFRLSKPVTEQEIQAMRDWKIAIMLKQVKIKHHGHYGGMFGR